MSTESLRTVRDRLSEFVERVQRQHDWVTITRNGLPAAVLISPDDLEALEETLEILSTLRPSESCVTPSERWPRATSCGASTLSAGSVAPEEEAYDTLTSTASATRAAA